MLQKIKNVIMVAILPLALSAPVVLAPAAVYADCSGSNIQSSLNNGINAATKTPGVDNCSADSGGPTINTVAQKVVNLLSIVVGIVAVVMIIVGGFRYIASGGASDKVSGAKNTLIYAIVGLVIVALAQFIVRFVLSSATGTN